MGKKQRAWWGILTQPVRLKRWSQLWGFLFSAFRNLFCVLVVCLYTLYCSLYPQTCLMLYVHVRRHVFGSARHELSNKWPSGSHRSLCCSGENKQMNIHDLHLITRVQLSCNGGLSVCLKSCECLCVRGDTAFDFSLPGTPDVSFVINLMYLSHWPHPPRFNFKF